MPNRDGFIPDLRRVETRQNHRANRLSSINPNVRYLHDGRARTLEEAVLWHGGQAAASRTRFEQLSADDRQSLLDFVASR